jgi:hypothetical protein
MAHPVSQLLRSTHYALSLTVTLVLTGLLWLGLRLTNAQTPPLNVIEVVPRVTLVVAGTGAPVEGAVV